MKRNQSGFTLIEIAIVLVIIGLLLGGVMKGQELINSAKVKNLATDFRNVPVYVYGYQDKYHAIPGDDANVQAHVGASAALAASAAIGNGVINGTWSEKTVTAESYLFWQQVRMAGLAPGPTDINTADLHPTNAMGGQIGITNSGADVPIAGMTGSFIVCSNNIPGKFAVQLDIALDDGETSTGALRVGDPSTGAAPLAAVTSATLQSNPDKPYLVCQGY